MAVATSELAVARAQLHSIAERVLAPDLARSTGRIGLRVTPGGIGQPEHVAGSARRRLRVDRGSLVVLDGDVETWHELTTLGAAAATAGVDLASPIAAYEVTSRADPGFDVAVDAAAAAELAEWFDLAERALERFRSDHADLAPSIPQLWPEHFDLGCTLAEVNFGASPGDAGAVDGGGGRVEPYLYVGPWAPRVGEFWNESYGAAIARSDIDDIEDAVAFLEQGLHEARRR